VRHFIARYVRFRETRVYEKNTSSGSTAFTSALQVQAAANESRHRYDALASGDSVYNYHRDYEPSLGRYLESDPIGLYGGINTYGYVRGRPLTSIDPLGLSEQCAYYKWACGVAPGLYYCFIAPPNCESDWKPLPPGMVRCIRKCLQKLDALCLASCGPMAMLHCESLTHGLCWRDCAIDQMRN
jgi:RHS repeat-associated protein